MAATYALIQIEILNVNNRKLCDFIGYNVTHTSTYTVINVYIMQYMISIRSSLLYSFSFY